MVDIDDVIKRLLDHPAKELYYSISQGKFLDVTKNQVDYERDMDLCCLCGAKKCWEFARKTFMERHPGVFPELPERCSASKWNSLIKANGFEKEWFEQFRMALAESVTGFVELFSLKEVEAEPELYREITKELKIFEAKHYEKKYSDMVLFYLGADYEIVPMTILGNAGNVFGVSFYPGDKYGDNFRLIQNQEALNIDPVTSHNIMTMVSFYFEHEKPPYGFTKDPYECDRHITSACIDLGTLSQCYLPKSIAIRSLSYLRNANREMAAFAASREGKKLKDNHFYSVCLDEGKFAVRETNPQDEFDGHLPYDFNDVDYPDVRLQFKKNGAFDATIRCLPDYTTEPEDDDRTVSFNLIAIMCDHETGYIHTHSLADTKGYHPFDKTAALLAKDLQGIKIPKTIYVNSYLDFYFYRAFFAEYTDQGKVDVKGYFEQLQSDVAFDSLNAFLQKKMDEEDKKETKRKLAQA